MRILLLVCVFGFSSAQKSIPQPSASSTPATDFTCPEDFGYFPHPSDCSQYYVCVFGGALLESCTGGLMYSHDLQTCDWPRNVYCYNGTTFVDNNNVQQQPATVPQESRSRSRGTPAPVQNNRNAQYGYNPIKIETYGQLRNAAEESVIGRKPGRISTEDEVQAQRSGRSYEGSLPNYKEEIYQQASNDLTTESHVREKRASKLLSYFRNKKSTSSSARRREASRIRKPRSRIETHKSIQHLDITDSRVISKYKLPAAGLKHKPLSNPSNLISHRVSSPGSVLYPPSYYQTPTYGFVNIREIHNNRGPPHQPSKHDHVSFTTSSPVVQASRVVRITTSKPYNFIGGPHNNNQWTDHDKTLHDYVQQNYINRLNTHGTHNTFNAQSNDFPKKIILSTGTLNPHVSGVTFLNINNNAGSVSPNTRSKFPSQQSNKYDYNTAAVITQQQQTQQRVPQDYGTTDDAYASQRYAANIGNNTNAYFYTGTSSAGRAPAAAGAPAPAAVDDDDSSYYVYDDEEEDPGQTTGQKYNNDFDYKYQQPVTYRTTTTTRRPTTQATSPPRTSSRGSSRGSTRGSSSSSSSSSGRSRPTNKPKSSIVKAASAPVRDVYADPPSRPENVYETPVPNTPATKCRKDLCVLPDCNCGGKDIPGGLRLEETPQIVLLTFDDSVNDLNKNLYRDLFEKGRKNPNGCPISATFYISHEWTDYSQVQNLAADGHELASHSVSHSFGEQYSQKKWDREINGQREILAAYGGVKMSEVRGMRAPFLSIGGNNMFKMLHDSNFTYDSSMPVYENRPPSWPYTLDYRIFHDCMIPPCPTKSYPGVWEVPMVMWQDLKGGRCSMGDACSNPPTAEGVYQMLAKNFERHYTTNRAPFGLYYHAAWFTQPHHKEGFEAFLDTLVQMDDVWLVTNWQALQWVRNPTPINRLQNFAPFNCQNQDRPPRCNHPKVCNLWHKSGVRYMKTCQSCPEQYPWTGNTGVPYSNSL